MELSEKESLEGRIRELEQQLAAERALRETSAAPAAPTVTPYIRRIDGPVNAKFTLEVTKYDNSDSSLTIEEVSVDDEGQPQVFLSSGGETHSQPCCSWFPLKERGEAIQEIPC